MSQRPFAVFDIDGTLIRWQLFHAIVDALAHAGFIDNKDFAKVQGARMTWKKRARSDSFEDYELKLVLTYIKAVTTIKRADFDRLVEGVFEEYKDQVYTYTRDLLRELKAKNYLLFAISGSHQEIIAKLADYYGFDDFIGAIFEEKAGRFTGQVNTPRGRKAELLKSLVQKHRATFSKSVAVGDSESDIPMLEIVKQPIAFNPNQSLFEHAKAHGWPVIVERKNVVYKLEPKSGKYLLA